MPFFGSSRQIWKDLLADNNLLFSFSFRMGVSLIMTQKLRFILDSDTICPICMEEEEDEIHFILHCPVYHDLRLKYLAPFDSPPNVNTFQLLLRSVDESLIKSLCTYLNQAFKRNTVTYGNCHS